MADILFLPTCSACGQIIKEDVGIFLEESYATNKNGRNPINFQYPEVYPVCCPNCGVFLNNIIMPGHPKNNKFNWDYKDWKVFMEWM